MQRLPTQQLDLPSGRSGPCASSVDSLTPHTNHLKRSRCLPCCHRCYRSNPEWSRSTGRCTALHPGGGSGSPQWAQRVVAREDAWSFGGLERAWPPSSLRDRFSNPFICHASHSSCAYECNSSRFHCNRRCSTSGWGLCRTRTFLFGGRARCSLLNFPCTFKQLRGICPSPDYPACVLSQTAKVTLTSCISHYPQIDMPVCGK